MRPNYAMRPSNVLLLIMDQPELSKLVGVAGEKIIQCSLNFYIKNISVNSKLSERNVSYKVSVLLSLFSAFRASSIQHPYIRFMSKTNSGHNVCLTSFIRVWKGVKLHQHSRTTFFSQDERLYVVRTLDEYIARTPR